MRRKWRGERSSSSQRKMLEIFKTGKRILHQFSVLGASAGKLVFPGEKSLFVGGKIGLGTRRKGCAGKKRGRKAKQKKLWRRLKRREKEIQYIELLLCEEEEKGKMSVFLTSAPGP